MTNPYVIALVLVLLAGATAGGLAAGGVFKTYNPQKQTYNSPYQQLEMTPKRGSINPQPFKTGYLKNSPQPIADNCNSTMYPIQPPYVQYGPDFDNVTMDMKNCEKCARCDVNIFNSPP